MGLTHKSPYSGQTWQQVKPAIHLLMPYVQGWF